MADLVRYRFAKAGTYKRSDGTAITVHTAGARRWDEPGVYSGEGVEVLSDTPVPLATAPKRGKKAE